MKFMTMTSAAKNSTTSCITTMSRCDRAWKASRPSPGRLKTFSTRTAPATTAGLVQLWGGKLKAGARTMLEVLVNSRTNGLTREQLAGAAQLSAGSGTFASYLSSLTTNVLCEKRSGRIYPSETLFPPLRANG